MFAEAEESESAREIEARLRAVSGTIGMGGGLIGLRCCALRHSRDIGEQSLFRFFLVVIRAFFLAFATGEVPFPVNVEEPAAAEGHGTQFTLTMSAHSRVLG